MKKITRELFFLLLTVMGVFMATAQVAPNGLWFPVGDVLIEAANNDNDNGDGLNDGAFKINGQSAVDGQGVSFVFNGTMQDGVNYAIVSTMYNFTGNYAKVIVSLYNKTDGVELAVYNAAGTVLNTSNPEELVTFNYTAVATDVGDVLELRYIRNDGGATSRDFWVDNASLNGTFVTEALAVVSPTGTWTVMGNTLLEYRTTDADNGDGVGDGAYYVDGLNNVDNPQGAKFILDEAMVNGRRYKAETTIYKEDTSYARIQLQLYNATDNVALATSGQILIDGTGPINSGSITYDATASDDGDVLEIRFIRSDDLNTARNFTIDIAKINNAAFTIVTLGVEDNVLRDAISIYPNPTNSILNISKSNANIAIKNVSLINIIGKTVYTDVSAKNIDVSSFSKGLYILKIESQDGAVAARKIVVN